MVQTLQWDSDFFALKIGRVNIHSNEFGDLYKRVCAREKSHDLVYVFANQALVQTPDNVTLVDIKTIYAKSLSVLPVVSEEITTYTDCIPNDDLYHLALVSGKHSRYKLDQQLPDGSYERLYKRWIEQSTNGNMADKVLVHKSGDIIDGMLTIRIQDNVASIGLIAVDENTQDRGIGTKLIHAVEHFLLSETSVRYLDVATQWENVGARCFYEKCGFAVESKTYIYHWWV